MNFPDGIVILEYRPACVLRATGADAGVFLQGQFTNDLSTLEPGGSTYGLWLDRKGKVLADSRVIRDGASAYWIASVSSPAAVVAGHLGAHVIADEVEIENQTDAWKGLALIGRGAGDWLANEAGPGIVFPGRRSNAENFEWLLPAGARADALPAAARIDAVTAERMRIRSGIASVPADIGPADLPNEGGLDSSAISYTKGCYLGQEVMARLRSMGRIRRRLVRVRGEGDPPRLPALLWQAGSRVGEIRSAAADASGFDALALVRAEAAVAGSSLALGPAPEGAPAVRVETQ
jgi:folate-binding protein YgfZ